MTYALEPSLPHKSPKKTGLLFVNLGTPDAPTPAALRRYLGEFLSDPRMVEIPRWLWMLILHGIILRTRPKKSAQKYASIWTPTGSPLAANSHALMEGVAKTLKQEHPALECALAMRYGQPSIEKQLAALKAKGCTKIAILPLYPQYAASSTASVYDEVFRVLSHTRRQPALKTLDHFHDHPAYIGALAATIRRHWAKKGRGEHLLMSFHGIPKQSVTLGDPYACECRKTARLLAEALGLPQEAWSLSFQSRFGKAEWIQPYTTATLEELAQSGVKHLDVVCPGFVADCLETLEEIAHEAKADFLTFGGETFHYIPCLNAQPEAIEALSKIAETLLGEWIQP